MTEIHLVLEKFLVMVLLVVVVMLQGIKFITLMEQHTLQFTCTKALIRHCWTKTHHIL